MSKLNITEPNSGAFACTDNQDFLQRGLTKREYFAAMALQGMLSNSKGDLYKSKEQFLSDHAISSIELADELIKELNK
jgi:hypothetical protein